MDALQFAYWLQGYAELASEAPTAEQWQSIKEHLAAVFKKVTPPVKSPYDKINEHHLLPNITPGMPPWTQRPNTGTPLIRPPYTAECNLAGHTAAQSIC